MSSTLASLRPLSWVSEFRAFIMRGSVVDLVGGLPEMDSS